MLAQSFALARRVPTLLTKFRPHLGQFPLR